MVYHDRGLPRSSYRGKKPCIFLKIRALEVRQHVFLSAAAVVQIPDSCA